MHVEAIYLRKLRYLLLIVLLNALVVMSMGVPVLAQSEPNYIIDTDFSDGNISGCESTDGAQLSVYHGYLPGSFVDLDSLLSKPYGKFLLGNKLKVSGRSKTASGAKYRLNGFFDSNYKYMTCYACIQYKDRIGERKFTIGIEIKNDQKTIRVPLHTFRITDWAGGISITFPVNMFNRNSGELSLYFETPDSPDPAQQDLDDFYISEVKVYPELLTNKPCIAYYSTLPAYEEKSITFLDVPLKYTHWDAIFWAYNNGIMIGDGKLFGPEDSLTEAQFAVILAKYFNMTIGDNEMMRSHFADPYYKAIEKYNLPLFGYQSQDLMDKPMTRGQIARVIASLYGLDYSEDDAIMFMYKNQFSVGTSTTSQTVATYGRDFFFTRAAAASFMKKMSQVTWVTDLSDNIITCKPRCIIGLVKTGE